MIILMIMKKQFESKFLNDAPAFKYVYFVLASEANLGFWRLKLTDKWVLGYAIGDKLFFS